MEKGLLLACHMPPKNPKINSPGSPDQQRAIISAPAVELYQSSSSATVPHDPDASSGNAGNAVEAIATDGAAAFIVVQEAPRKQLVISC